MPSYKACGVYPLELFVCDTDTDSVAAVDQTLASVLGRLRQERGLTQEELAYNSKVTISALSRIERGLSNPTWTTLMQLAYALEITPTALIAAVEDAREQPSSED